MARKFYFLCGNFGKRNYIYAIKCAGHLWHYFEAQDTLSSVHGSLPEFLDSLIMKMTKISKVEVPLDEWQWRNYYDNEQFVFKNKQLQTYKDISEEGHSKSSKHTDQLVFISGQTNPLVFLKEFDKCRDVKHVKDKNVKILNFVEASDRAEFIEMCSSCDWQRVRLAFIEKYASSFTEIKKRELSIGFHEGTNLRSFVERKLRSLSLYTTLPFVNQMEMVLGDLPNEISELFLMNDVMTASKAEILDFCDSVWNIDRLEAGNL